MKGFLEQYGIAIFVLILMSILIAFASPIGKTIKNDITTKVNNIEEITDDETEIAKGNYYTIVFDGNGATSGSIKPMTYIIGKHYTLPYPKVFKKNGTCAVAWNTKKSGTGLVLNGEYFNHLDQLNNLTIVDHTITLYAQWNAMFDLNAYLDRVSYGNMRGFGTCDVYINGDLVQKDATDFYKDYPNGTMYEIRNIHVKKGYTYTGKSFYSGIIGSSFTSCYLSFITNTYTITYHANATDATGTTASSHHTYNKSASLTQNGFTRPGYMFLGWNTTADGSGTTYTDMQEVKNLTDQNNVNIDLYAMWKKN